MSLASSAPTPETIDTAAASEVVPPESTDTGEINQRAKKGIKMMMGRQVALQVITFLAGIGLARSLGPAEFGLYAIATFFVQALSQFGSFGLAPSLIQRRKELTNRDLVVAFTLQQASVSVIVLILILGAPLAPHFYPKAPLGLDWLIRAMSISLFFASWRTMSQLQIERKLLFGELARIEVIETIVFQGLAVLLAVTGHGVWSFVWALLAKGVVGVALTYMVAPWPVKFGWDKAVALSLFRYGVPFQIGILLNSLNGWLTPLCVGAIIGPQAVGYLNWASSSGKKPLVLVENVMRVSFPHFSRLQDDPKEVERLMQRYLSWLLLPSALWFALLFAAGPAAVKLIYTDKWAPAVLPLVLCALAVPLDTIVWLVSQTQNALGMVHLAMRRSAARIALALILGVILVLKIGYVGVPIAYLIALTISLPITFNGLPRGTMHRVLLPQLWMVIPTLAGCAAGLAAREVHLPLAASVIFIMSCASLAFAVPAWLLAPRWMRQAALNKLARGRAAQ